MKIRPQTPFTQKSLQTLSLEEDFLKWAIGVLKEQNQLEAVDRNKILAAQQKNYKRTIESLDNLISIYVSPENKDRSILNDEEFKNQKNTLTKQKVAIETEMERLSERVDEWLELSEKTFNFATYAKVWFEKGDFERKTEILRALGQNIILKDKKLSLTLHAPYLLIRQKKHKLELSINQLNKPQSAHFEDKISIWSG